ncbi:hypothetical protein BC332_19542 [Capsicum chinense]|nr:hypothetical protein BC332_19542 [Capsicum chinense]
MALLRMVRHPDLLSHVGRFSLIEDGALTMIVQNSNKLVLNHLAELEVYVRDMISGGALWELIHILYNFSQNDIRPLARQTLSSLTSQVEMRRWRIELELSYWFHSRVLSQH